MNKRNDSEEMSIRKLYSLILCMKDEVTRLGSALRALTNEMKGVKENGSSK